MTLRKGICIQYRIVRLRGKNTPSCRVFLHRCTAPADFELTFLGLPEKIVAKELPTSHSYRVPYENYGTYSVWLSCYYIMKGQPPSSTSRLNHCRTLTLPSVAALFG